MLKFIHPTSWLEVSREGVGRRRGGGGGGRGGGGRGRRNSAGQADMFFFVLHESFWYLFPGDFCPLPSALCPLPSALCPPPSALCPPPSTLQVTIKEIHVDPKDTKKKRHGQKRQM